MHAEWEPHEATWLVWPRDREVWPHELEELERVYLRMIGVLSGGEKVHVLVRDMAEEARVLGLLAAAGITHDVFFHLVTTASVWIRDYGPIILCGDGGRRALVRWQFNAWGGKYAALARDREVPGVFSDFLKLSEFAPDMVLEGGSIDVNGAGALLTTEQCLLHQNRNPQLKRQEIESRLKSFLGVRHIIWLGAGIAGDDTDGHVDDIARFVGLRTVLAARERDRSDPNFAPLEDNRRRLSKAVDQDGKPLEVIALPMPGTVTAKGERLPASYANFYIGNRCVLVPVFGDPNDDHALGILRDLFPKREVVGIPCGLLVRGLGALHCATREEPK